MNHLRTSSILSRGVAPDEMAANMSGCSHQYAGNSVKETGERMTLISRLFDGTGWDEQNVHGGAVI